MTMARGPSQKEAAEQVMKEAYMLASAKGTLPAAARQVMYAARPKIQELTGGKRLDDQYFCQTLLPNYMEEHGVDWNVVFDARGHLTEPHNGGEILPLGTLEVRGYLDDITEPLTPLAWLQEVVDTVVGQGLPGDYVWRDGLPYPRTLSCGLPCGSDSKWPPQFPRREAVDAFRYWAGRAKPFGASEYTGSPERFWAEICKVIPRVRTIRQIAGGCGLWRSISVTSKTTSRST